MTDSIKVSGIALLRAEVSDPDAVTVEGWDQEPEWSRDPETGLWRSQVLTAHNIFLDTGLEHLARRYSDISAPATPSHGWLSNGTGSVSRVTTTTDGASTLFKALGTGFGATAKAITLPSTINYRWGTTQADLTFAVSKMGLANAATNTSGNIEDIVGGTGTSPYGTQQFSYNAVTATTHNETWGVDVVFDPS